MASGNITAQTSLATPTPTMLLYAALSPFGVTDDRKITANALLSTITANISDISLQFDNGLGTSTVAAAGKGKLRYNNTTKTFQYSADGVAYAEFGGVPGSPANSVQFNNAGAFGGVAGFVCNSSPNFLVEITPPAVTGLLIQQATSTPPATVMGSPSLMHLHILNDSSYWMLGISNDASSYEWAAYLANNDIFSLSGADTVVGNATFSFALVPGTNLANYLFYPEGIEFTSISATFFGTIYESASDRFSLGVTATTPTAGTAVLSWTNTGVGILAPPNASFALDVLGNTRITGKLTVTGAIDPTSIRLSSGTNLYYESADGQTAAVSAANEGRIRYNQPTQTWQVSQNGAAYVNIATGAGGLTVGVTPIASGAAGRLLYETSGNVLGEVAGSSADANGALTLAATARTSGVAPYFTVAAPADTGLTATQEAVGVNFVGATRQHADGTVTTQREVVFNRPTYSFVSAGSIGTAATVAITGAPVAGSGATLTRTAALFIDNNGQILFGGGSNDNDVAVVRRGVGVLRIGNGTTAQGRLLIGTSSDTTNADLTVFATDASSRAMDVTSRASSTVDLGIFRNLVDDQTALNRMFVFQCNPPTTSTDGFGASWLMQLRSSTDDDQNAVQVDWRWTTAAHASRTAAYVISTVTGAAALAEVARFGGATGFLATPPVRTSGSPTHIRFVTPADTTLAADTESIFGQYGGNSSAATVTRQFTAGGGAFATQRENVFIEPTYAATSADTITTSFTLAVSAAPIAGTNMTLTNPYAFGVQSGETYFAGMVKVGSTTTLPTRQLQVVSGNTARVGLYVESAGNSTVDIAQFFPDVDDTATVANIVRFSTSSNGTPANGFGSGITFALETDSAGNQIAAQLQWLWTDAADGTRTADIVFLNTGSGTTAETFRITGNALPVWPNTVTAGGTTGNQTINKPSGTVNIAAAGTTVTVTNSLVTANSIVFAVIRTNDVTARIANVVPAAGSFVINIVACTAEVSIGWFVINK